MMPISSSILDGAAIGTIQNLKFLHFTLSFSILRFAFYIFYILATSPFPAAASSFAFSISKIWRGSEVMIWSSV